MAIDSNLLKYKFIYRLNDENEKKIKLDFRLRIEIKLYNMLK